MRDWKVKNCCRLPHPSPGLVWWWFIRWPRLAALFDVLDAPENDRQTNLDEKLASFAYINGNLFADRTRIPAFYIDMRRSLVRAAHGTIEA
jgi:hypothetical protein